MKTGLKRNFKLSGKHCSGLTLLEALIALVLGLLITIGILQLYLSNRQSYRLAESQARLQESARFALEFLTQDFRMAGYMGCLSRSLSLNSTLNTSTSYLYDFVKPVQGFEWNEATTAWLPAIDASITAPRDNGSDIITVRRADVNAISVTSHASGTASLTLGSAGTPALQNCELAVVADCSAATVFQISTQMGVVASHVTTLPCVPGGGNTTDPGPGNLTADLGESFSSGDVHRVSTTSYFIRTSNGEPALFRRINSQNTLELVEGIEAMEIFYGADTNTDGTADRYFQANHASLVWSEVVSVRIKLLVRSREDNLLPQASAAFNFNGVAIPVADKRLRREFTTTIAIRNRLR